MAAERQSFLRDERGSVILEFTVTVTVFFLVLFGIVEFSYLFYQWNTATKAVQFGARLAAVSDPVAEELRTLDGLGGSVLPGDPMSDFDIECYGSDETCTAGNYNKPAMDVLVFGHGNGITCSDTGANIGMCNIYDKIGPENVIIRYEYTGLGYAGRPGVSGNTGGAVPTITVRLTGLTFNFVMLNGLVPGLTSVQIPGLNTTITGEDLGAAGG